MAAKNKKMRMSKKTLESAIEAIFKDEFLLYRSEDGRKWFIGIQEDSPIDLDSIILKIKQTLIDNDLGTHKHNFIIPVEWRQHSIPEPDSPQHYIKRIVTKLRCECGNELSRND